MKKRMLFTAATLLLLVLCACTPKEAAVQSIMLDTSNVQTYFLSDRGTVLLSNGAGRQELSPLSSTVPTQ